VANQVVVQETRLAGMLITRTASSEEEFVRYCVSSDLDQSGIRRRLQTRSGL
jgi:hypothetical protein